ncbi:peptide MFS transporter [Pseudonocardia acidicola]|uniref:Peptide MFS transporter n=1 Tax=Pseudonocardia acidicola TaxID=2724939 RepID=A0ABX1SHG0_9PSEU|nr:peptide MFS transporter [Pseudonocardia acidicola]NMH99987.1 peptide MFS transporter [Pseudonocardia acidicola]
MVEVVTDVAKAAPPQRTFFGQPPLLANLFGVEMWERFSFYGMQGILLIYLYYSAAHGGLGIDETTATSIVGAYGGLVYLSTILGAWLADRVLGAERTLFSSAVLVMLGHIALAVLPGLLGVGVGLVLIAFGSGGVKANATSLVGSLYAEGDERRDAGFSLFYLGINLGALVGPLLTGLLQTGLGFHYGFGLAAVGMAVGLVQYTVRRRRLPEAARTVPSPLPTSRRGLMAALAVGAVAAVAVLATTGVLRADNLADIVVGLSLLATIGYFTIILGSRRITSAERRRVLAFVPMFIASTAFWSLYQQQFTVVTIYSDQRLNRTVLGWQMPVSFIQSINPVFIILLAGVFAALWTRLGPRQPSTPIKFALGTATMGVAFLLFLPMAGGGPNSAPLAGLVGILFVFTIAELLLSPVGLSLSTKLAPAAFRTQMVALFFLSVALGTALSGTLAQYYDEAHEGAYFGVLGLVAIALGLVLALITPFLRRLMGGVR